MIREGDINGKRVKRGGKDRGINRTCPLKFSSVSAREQQQKKKEVSPDAVH